MYAKRCLPLRICLFLPLTLPFTIIALAQWIYYKRVFLYYYNTNYIPGYILSLLFYSALLLAIMNLLLCTLSGPGDPKIEWSTINLPYAVFVSEEDRMKFEEVYPLIVLDRSTGLKYEYCSICKIVTPPDTSHCSVCNKCTLRLDHHCPWVANCIGFCNQKFFILFCFYSGVASNLLGIPLCFQFYNMINNSKLEDIVISIIIL